MTIFNTTQILKASENLVYLIRELNQQKNMVEAEISDLETQYNTIIHRIERFDCLYKERSRLATQISIIQRKRRVLKDWMKINQPYFDYIGGENGEKMQAMLGNVVSIGRKVKDKEDMKKLREKVDRKREI